MISSNPNSSSTVQPELASGEHILWAGQPELGVTFHREDYYLIPFSLMWGGFAIFWEVSVAGIFSAFNNHSDGAWTFGMFWGIPFVLIGQYMIWGRFLHARWKKKRTHYAVTDRRVIQVFNGRNRKVESSFIDVLPAIIKETRFDGVGTLRFSQSAPYSYGRGPWDPFGANSTGPAFIDIADAESVYSLISDQKQKLASPSSRY